MELPKEYKSWIEIYDDLNRYFEGNIPNNLEVPSLLKPHPNAVNVRVKALNTTEVKAMACDEFAKNRFSIQELELLLSLLRSSGLTLSDPNSPLVQKIFRLFNEPDIVAY